MSIKHKIDEIFSLGGIGNLVTDTPLQETDDHECEFGEDGKCTICSKEKEE
jgi:hypothetical protein